MNAKHNHCTNKCLLSAALLVLCFQGVRGQTEYDKTMDLNFWNDGRNVAGLRTETPVKISYAELYGGIESGDFKASYDASSAWKAGAVAKTCTDFEKFSMVGSFSFSQKQGRNMCGSMFINPGLYPVDVLEFTPGTKTLQSYSFTGGIAVPLNERWSVGGKMDFESDNYSKRKDIRHTNYRLDITLAPSVMLSLDGGLNLGFTYILNKTSESVLAEQIGTASASSYYAFLDKGMMYGTYEVWNGSGIHLKEAGVDRFAVKELSNGAALQIQKISGSNEIYADIEWSSAKGEVGEKSYTFYRFPGSILTVRAGFKMRGSSGTSVFRLGYVWKRQENNEYVIEKVTSGGITTPVTYGNNKIYERRFLSVVPEYTFYGSGQLGWLYRARAEAGFTKRKEQSSVVYPYSYTGSSSVIYAAAEVLMQFKGFRMGLGAQWQKGLESSEKEDTASGFDSSESLGSSGSSGPSSSPFRLEDWHDLDNEWRDAARIGASLSLRYGFSIGKVSGLYAEAAGSALQGFKIIHSEGTSRFTGILKLGYEF